MRSKAGLVVPGGSPEGAGLALTPSAERVYERVLLGESNREIAEELGCTVKNVEYHVTRILKQSGTTSRTRLIARSGGAAPEASNGRGRRLASGAPASERPWLRLVR